MSKTMVMGIASGNLEKLTVAGILLSGAIAQDIEVKVYLLLGGAYAFKKDVAEDFREVKEFPELKQQFMEGLKNANVPYWLEFFKKAKELGKVQILACGTAGKIWGAVKREDFNEIVDDICGVSEYISALEESDMSILI